jgi:DNA replication and repair protein RecF
VILRALRVRGWRNLGAITLHPGARATVLHGQNGQGKTNLLEAAYYAVTFRSFRTHAQGDLICWGCPAAAIEAEIVTRGVQRLLRIQLGQGKKTTLLDGKAVRRDSSALEGAAVVLFGPDELRLPKAPAAERRRFLDRAVFASFRPYFREALAFEKALRGRNALLRSGPPSPVLLDSHDEQLAARGARIVLRRRALVEKLAGRFAEAFSRIHGGLHVGAQYRSTASVASAVTEEEVTAALLEELRRERAADLRRGFTGSGPQTDDLELQLAGHPARQHGSQGQLRALVLALKIAELEHLGETIGEPPLLLLDDVASELDLERRGKLFETIAALSCQTLITVTEPEHLPLLPERVDFEMVRGAMGPGKPAE